MALLDCCREKLPQEKMRGGNPYNDDGILAKPDENENLIITFGCQPSEGVPAKSTIAKAYFRHLRRSANILNRAGQFALPGNLSFFQGVDKKCEHTTRVTAPLLLNWTDQV